MSLRNLTKRREHRERAQPSYRARYGLLEKKKDYKLRAKDYHKKEDKLKKLKRQAALRNPDEFYYKMIKSTTEDGSNHTSYAPPSMISSEELQILRTQDIGYLLTALQKENKHIQRLESLLSVQQTEEKIAENRGNKSKINKHTIFVDDEDEFDSFSTEKYFNSPKDLIVRKHNRLKVNQLEEPVIISGKHLLHLNENDTCEETTKSQRKSFRKLQKLQQKNYIELKERRERAKKIKFLIQEKQLEKNMNANEEKERINNSDDDEDERPIYKWKAIRKK